MEFDFLPKLPNSKLDDRTFDDLVDECILRIPRYCPEWTDHNLSDPGVTLIELFAWVTDQMLMRFNQVPRKNYVAFLELLGLRLQAPASAQTELTFYLSSDLSDVYTIPTGVEVATERTQTNAAITFTTDQPLVIGKPRIRHFLTAQTTDDTPQALRDRLSNQWTRQPNGNWHGSEQLLFNEQPQVGNCFYLVLEPDSPLDGNVLAITFNGAAAIPTGINPNQPPRCWEAWDGQSWQPILLKETDDATRGFSFNEAQQGNTAQAADVILHLPQQFPVTSFTAYQGRWLRCSYVEPERTQPAYSNAPRIVSLAVRAIGGTVRASHSLLIREERLGVSDGTPGQMLQLLGSPVLERRQNEYILVTPAGGLPQRWQEVRDFADSSPQDRHYILDSLTGTVQFGPLIREPDQLAREIQLRSHTQQLTRRKVGLVEDIPLPIDIEAHPLEHQYGAIPPRGSAIAMVAYRTGGGRQGNVQAGTLQFLKSSIPYVASVTNHIPARNGADGESLEQAVLRAPQVLRTRDRAVTAEDFEILAHKGAAGGIARVKCLPATATSNAGMVQLLVVPQADTQAIAQGLGIAPEAFALQPALEEQISSYLDERRLLGVQVQLQEPEYVGVSVQTEVGLEPVYNNPSAQQQILSSLRIALYRYLNPLTGGPDGTGWPFGRPVYTSDIIAQLQQTPGVLYVGAVLLFAIRKQRGGNWTRQPAPEPLIDPGQFGLVCSWANAGQRSNHIINLSSR